jgi:hypothetical protein
MQSQYTFQLVSHEQIPVDYFIDFLINEIMSFARLYVIQSIIKKDSKIYFVSHNECWCCYDNFIQFIFSKFIIIIHSC